MEKKFGILFLVCFLFFVSACKKGYRVEKDHVYYEYWNEGNGQKEKIVQGADPKTFESFTLDGDCSFSFGRDEKHLFIDGMKVEGIDPKSFASIGNYIFRDKKNAYYLGSFNEVYGGQDYRILGVNPSKVKLLSYSWAMAESLLIHCGDTLYLEDINDFMVIDEYWGNTKSKIIYENKIINGVDTATFKIEDASSGKDKYHSYFNGFIEEEEFIKTQFKDYVFDLTELLRGKAYQFTDIYPDYLAINDETINTLKVAQKLKSMGFKIVDKRVKEWFRGPLIVIVSLSKENCNCYVEKAFISDFKNYDSTVFQVTERLYCAPRY